MDVENLYLPELIETPYVTKKLWDNKEIDCIEVEISGDEYGLCEQTAPLMWTNEKSQTLYNTGCGSTKSDPYKPIRTGLLGQMAVGKVFGEPVDLTYRKHGDQYDILFGTYLVDVKCSMQKNNCVLIYRRSENGSEIPLNKDIYIFSYVKYKEDQLAKKATIGIAGFVFKEDLLDHKEKLGRVRNSRHYNIEVLWGEMRSISKLLYAKEKYFGRMHKKLNKNHLEFKNDLLKMT